MQPLHSKVKVPAVIGTVLTITLAVLAAVGAGVPSIAPVCTAAVTALQTISGYFTYAD